MRIGRTLPPAAAPIPFGTILRALPACLRRSGRHDGFFEEEIKQYCGSRYCFLVSSGKAALVLILSALKKLHPDRDTVLLPAFTCYSVPAAVKRAGLKIALCDTAPSSLGLDTERLKKIVTAEKRANKILCIIVTHLFGCPENYGTIRAIAGPDIPIVEDAAQAMGEEMDGRKLGTLGDAGFYSLGRGKALSTMGGGVIVTSRDDMGKELKKLTRFLPILRRVAVVTLAIKALLAGILQRPQLFWLPKSLPFLRLGETIYDPDFPITCFSPFQRKLARDWRERLEQHRTARKENIDFWKKRLPEGFSMACQTEGHGMIRLPILARTGEERQKLINLSEQAGYGIMPAYPTPIHEIPQIAREFSGQQYPHAKDVCMRLFTIPVHEYITINDNKQILDLVWQVSHIV